MEIKKNNMKRLNKRGIVDKFLTLLFVGLYIGAVFFILFLILNATMSEKKAQYAQDVNVLEGMYSSRIILNYQIEPNYKLYDAAIDAVNTGNSDKFHTQISDAIRAYYPDKIITEKWLIMLNDECFMMINSGDTSSSLTIQTQNVGGAGVSVRGLEMDSCSDNVIDSLPKITIPNPDGKNIMFLAKPYSLLDEEQGRVFGYKAGLLKGYSKGTMTAVSCDNSVLEEIKNIPNVNCDESETSYGKICAADPALVAQLRKISAEKLQKEGITITVNQAYRDYVIQKNIFEDYCNKDGNSKCDDGETKACNPDKSACCPHMQAGAIDVNVYKAGKDMNSADPAYVENLMCDYGFVRWMGERWHFEYGTNQWNNIVEQRNGGRTPCTYGSK